MTLNPLPGRLPKKKNELFNSLRKLQVRFRGGGSLASFVRMKRSLLCVYRPL